MLERQIDWLEGELYTTKIKKCTSIMATNAKAHIEARQDEDRHIRVALPWEHMRNTLHVDNLDDRL